MRVLDSTEVAEAVRSGHTSQRIARIPTGFPSPAEDMAEAPLSLDDLLVWHPASTFFVEMESDALQERGIIAGDVLVVDRALYATGGALVIASLDGNLIARHYCPDGDALQLLAAHPDYAPISIGNDARDRYEIWGVVTGVVRHLHRHQ